MGRNLDTAGNDFGRLRQVGASAESIPQIDMTQATTPMRPVQASGLHPKRMPTPSDIALHIRRMLKLSGSGQSTPKACSGSSKKKSNRMAGTQAACAGRRCGRNGKSATITNRTFY